MAKPNMLPILALGAAALLLMKKKGGTSTNGETNGKDANGKTKPNGNGATGGNGKGEMTPVSYAYMGPCPPEGGLSWPDGSICVQLGGFWGRLKPSDPDGPLSPGERYEQVGGPITSGFHNCGPGDAPGVLPSGAICVEINGSRQAIKLIGTWTPGDAACDPLDPTTWGVGNVCVDKDGEWIREPESLPNNVSLEDIGDFNWGVKVIVGTDMTDDQTVQIIDMVAMHAKNYPALPFVVTLTDQGLGILVTVFADGLPYWKPANTPEGAGMDLTQLLDERIPNSSGT